ncbi:hypothetical protein Anas_04379 [Armadillidium nasatum]|uniref:Uncharacterized protein n=1 Tax=Armadillidium nasatum TaxID=96803 RepID=A0A5N5SWX2_9CRUS|nr:hypothetical protein Anas_04379 [Armadillidium nasatum]
MKNKESVIKQHLAYHSLTNQKTDTIFVLVFATWRVAKCFCNVMDSKLEITARIKDIVKSLKTLGYQPESWSSEYIKLVLLKQCALRKDLLLWILKILGFHYLSPEVKLFNDSLIKKIVADLSSVGLCKPQDINLINGKASCDDQLKFWKLLINTSLKVKQAKCSSSSSEDSLLFDLEEKLTLLPEDLKPLYRSFGKSIPLKEKIQDLKQEYSEEAEGKDLDTGIKRESNREDETFTELLDNISSLQSQNKEYLNAYESSLKPWCKFSAVSAECSSRTGELASAYNEELNLLLQSVSLANNIKNAGETVEKRMESIKLIQQDNSPSQLLQAIADSNFNDS